MLNHRYIPVLLLIFIIHLKLEAWGKTGHRIVGAIAELHLSGQAKDISYDLLNGQSLAHVANWADEIRGDPAWSHSYPWHYVNIAPASTYAKSSKNPKGDVLRKIKEFSAALARGNLSIEKRAQAIKWLVHLVGDLHQPLHAGYAKDEGGNKVKVSWFGRPTNLHKVWDEDVMLYTEFSYSEYADYLNSSSTQTPRTWQQDTSWQWLKESRILLPQVYKIGDGNLSYAYAETSRKIIEKRLLQAGIRLAAILNRVLGKSRGK